MTPSEQDERFVGYLGHYLVSLGCISTSSRLFPPATVKKFFTSAFVLELDGSWYLVTAGHVLEAIADYLERHRELQHQFVIFAGFGTFSVSRELARFAYREPVFCVDRPEGLDFGAIRLEPRERSGLQANGVLAIEQPYWDQGLPPQFSQFGLFGLPIQDMELDIPRIAAFRPLYLRVENISTVPEQFRSKTDPMRYFRVMEPSRPDLDIKGMSGCPVFAFWQRDGQDMQMLCCGMQSSWLEKERVLAACDLRFAGLSLREAIVGR